MKNQEFNIRISFDSEGNPVIGMVQEFFEVGSNAVKMARVSAEAVADLAKALGVSEVQMADARSFAVRRKIA